MSSKQEKKIEEVTITHKHETKDNAIAALDKLKEKVEPAQV